MSKVPGNKLPPIPGDDEPVKLMSWTIFGRELKVIARVMDRYHLVDGSQALRIIINEYAEQHPAPAEPDAPSEQAHK